MTLKQGSSPSQGGKVESDRPVGLRNDPISVAVNLRPYQGEKAKEHFKTTDPGVDVTRLPLIGKFLARAMKDRKFQFLLIVPNQIIFWIVIAVGIFGIADPGRNFGPAITWYLWFCLVFVMMVVVGRAWCSMCPFGGFGEWIQRKSFFKRTQKALGLGRKVPESWAGYGLVISVATFIFLTYIEEYFNIAGPGAPIATSFMVIGIVTTALLSFLVFERRSFCRYICPLSSLIGSVGSMGMVAGFRTRDREVCMSCQTKDCMRGSEDGFGCPWYTWPGSADSNALCGLCSECYKSCPSDNIGLYVQAPLTSVIQPVRRRLDIGIAVAALFGLVFYQQYNALGWYGTIDNKLNSILHWPHYPDPVAYLGGIGLGALAVWGLTMLVRAIGKPLAGSSSKSSWFTTIAYALIPITGADYFSRQLPKFFKHVARVGSAIVNPIGIHPGIYNTRLLTNPSIVSVQLAVMGLGTAASLYAAYRISLRDLGPQSSRPKAVVTATLIMVFAISVLATIVYMPMHAAS